MTKKQFEFKNQSLLPAPKKKPVSSNRFQYGFFYSSFLILFLFFSLKSFYFFKKNHQPISKVSQEGPMVPLLLNLKSRQGPRLARVQVFISVKAGTKTEAFSKQEELKKQLLFLLSGQPIQELNKKSFQSRIQKQLNAFLSDSFVQDLNINMKVLN